MQSFDCGTHILKKEGRQKSMGEDEWKEMEKGMRKMMRIKTVIRQDQ